MLATKKLLPAVAACAALCVPAAASAAPPVKTPVKGQSSAVKTQSNTKLTKSVASLSKGVKSFGAAIAKLRTQQTDTATKLQTVLDGVPAIVSGLTQLQAGLTTVGSAFQAVEYGALTSVTNGPDGVQVSPALVSPDIPDDGNPAGVSAQIPISVSGASQVTLKAAIRSNESDGKATGDPAGQVGASLYAQCVGTCAGGALPAGRLACAPTQTPASTFSIPDGTTRSLNLKNIQVANTRTSSAPDVNSVDSGASPCALPGAGTYIIYINAQFVDIPTSLTPGPTD